MIETKTLAQIIEEGYQFPNIIPNSLQETITDWFALRHVSDDENFERYFNRILNRDYHRYNELIRIEAGVGEINNTAYDWLVNSYLERETITDTQNSADGTSTETMTGAVTDTFTPRAEKVVETSGEDNYGKTETVNRGFKRINSGTDATTISYGRVDTSEGSGHENSGTSNDAISTATAKTTPASVLVSRYDAGENGEAYATSDSNQITVSMGDMRTWYDELKSPSSISQAVDHSLLQSGIARDNLNTNTASGEDVNSLVHGHIVADTDNGTTKQGGKDTRYSTTIESYLGENVTEKGYDTTNEKSNQSSESGSSTVREIYTGRNGENMATALEKAKRYIQTTSAWEWLSMQLEPCFMAVYDI